MAHSFLKNYLCCTLLLLFSHFLILFGSGFLPFGSFRLTPMTDTNEEAPPPADIVIKPEEAEDDKVSSRTQALPAGNRLSKKAKVSHVREGVDREKYIEPVRRNIHILKLEWDWAAKVGQARQMDDDNVEARLESLHANPPRQPLEATFWMDEGTDLPSVVCHRTLLYTCAVGGVLACNFVSGMSFGSFFLQNADFLMCRQQALRHCKAAPDPGYATVGSG